MSETADNEQTISIDGKDVKVSDLSPQARGLLAFLTRIDEELRDARYQLDRAQMARQQALQQLTRALNAKEGEEEAPVKGKKKAN
ncbi:MAG: hypothetical protein ACPGGG_04785 [Parvibaculales bacterium]